MSMQDHDEIDQDDGSNSEDNDMDGERFDEDGEDDQDDDLRSNQSNQESPILMLNDQHERLHPPITTSISQIEPQQVRFVS